MLHPLAPPGKIPCLPPTLRAEPGAILLLLVLLVGACVSAPKTPVDHARAMFKRYVALEKKYDPAVYDLYSDNATIRRFLITAGDTTWSNPVGGAAFKFYGHKVIGGARYRGAGNTYRDVTYHPEGQGVRMTMRRFQEPPGAWLDQIFLVWPDTDGVWRIQWEISELPGRR